MKSVKIIVQFEENGYIVSQEIIAPNTFAAVDHLKKMSVKIIDIKIVDQPIETETAFLTIIYDELKDSEETLIVNAIVQCDTDDHWDRGTCTVYSSNAVDKGMEDRSANDDIADTCFHRFWDSVRNLNS